MKVLIASMLALAGLAASLALLLPGSAAAGSAPAATEVAIDVRDGGLTFDGVGALSAGASSRLLYDYPEPQRSQVLDYLFKPDYGASLQILKVEIGGDTNSTDGSESSHMHSRGDLDCDRGYEWWLMEEAVKRNPHIKLAGLAWGAPGWIGNGNFFSEDNIDYQLKWLDCARQHGLRIDNLGIWNERPYDAGWIKQFRAALDSHGYADVKVVAADGCCGSEWNIADDMARDGELKDAVNIIGAHYPAAQSTETARSLGKPLWASEDGPWSSDWGANRNGASIPALLNRNYITGRMTATEFWSPVTSYYDSLALPGSGLFYANTPWSGAYSVRSAVWAVAHTTQFAEPGWRYIDSASGYLDPSDRGQGSYVTLRPPEGTQPGPDGLDYSTVIETMGASTPRTVDVSLAGGASTGTVRVWRTNATNWFEHVADVTPQNGHFSLTVEPGSLYTITTTTGQHKGDAQGPGSAAFPFPYADSFDKTERGQQPRYFSQQEGSFEGVPCGGGRQGGCVEQVVGAASGEFSYYGSWSSASGSGSYGDTFHYSNQAGDYLTLTFQGTGIKLYGLVDSNQGIGAVSIDDGPATDVDFYGPQRVGNQLLWTSPQLPSGAHTLRLTVTGRKSPQASPGYYVVPDRVQISPGETSVDDRTTAEPIRWSGSDTPHSVIGDPGWSDYRVSADVRLNGGGTAELLGRTSSPVGFGWEDGYRFRVAADGTWQLIKHSAAAVTVLASGDAQLDAAAWHELALGLRGSELSPYLDGARLTVVHDDSYRTGQAGLGSGWNSAVFDDFHVTPDTTNGSRLEVSSLRPDPISVSEPGDSAQVSVDVTNPGPIQATHVAVQLEGPAGSSATPVSTGSSQLARGETSTWTWRLTAPSTAQLGVYQVSAKVSYRSGDQTASASRQGRLVIGMIPHSHMTATATIDAGTWFDFCCFPRFAIDDDVNTIWHTPWSPPAPLPQSITLHLDSPYDVDGLLYQPRIDGNLNGTILDYVVYVSTDDTTFTRVAGGTWADDATEKSARFSSQAGVVAVKLEAIQGQTGYASAAELNLIGHPSDTGRSP